MAIPEVVSVSEWIRTIATASSPVLVVLGWWWVNRQSNSRETRKELRQLVDRTLKSVGDAVDLGMKYQAGKSDEKSGRDLEAWKITLALGQVAGQIVILGLRGLKAESCHDPFIQLKQALTGNDFMTKTWAPWKADDARWMETMHATNSLSHALDRLFFDSFQD